MDEKKISEALKLLKEHSKDRKFNETIDVVINLRNLDMKKPENKVDIFIRLPNGLGKEKKICAFVAPESKDSVKAADKIILIEQFDEYQKDKKKAKMLADEYDFFIAQGDMMAKVAAAFGKILGPRGKMPNPKAAAVFPPKTDVTALVKKLKETIRLQTKNDSSIIYSVIGSRNMEEKKITENFEQLMNSLIHALPAEKNNIKSVIIKTTMGKPVKVAL